MNVLITGASGYLAKNIALSFTNKGFKVFASTRNPRNIETLIPSHYQDTYEIVTHEDAISVLELCSPDVVIHTACAYGKNGDSLHDMVNANILSGINLLDAVLKVGNDCLFVNIDTVLDPHLNLYASTKHCFSIIAETFSKHLERSCMKFCNLKLQTMYGPNDSMDKITSYLLRHMVLNRPSIDLTSCKQLRDFIFIEDVVSAVATVIMRRGRLNSYETIDVGTGKVHSLRFFAELIKKETGSETILNFGTLPDRSDANYELVADTEKLFQLGWKPRYDAIRGVAQMVMEEDKQR